MTKWNAPDVLEERPRRISKAEIDDWTQAIGKMTQIEMASLRRFAPAGHPVFRNDLPLYEIFEKRFNELGGMSPDISKAIGWRS